MSRVRLFLAGLVAMAVTAGTAALTRVPVTLSGAGEGVVRLSWRMQGASAEACRVPSEEELARLPVHMRNPSVCAVHVASYHLVVDVDGVRMVEDTVRPPGARGDRPITVLRDVPVSPGSRRVHVSFVALLPEGTEATGGAARLFWAGAPEVGAGEVFLVTLDEGGRALVPRSR